MKPKFPEDLDTKQTQELPKITSRRKELLELERKNQLIVEKNRRELNLIAQSLTSLADRINDPRTQMHIYNGLLPTAKAVASNMLPESMEIELNNLDLLADTIAGHLSNDDAAAAEIVRVKTLVRNVLSNISAV